MLALGDYRRGRVNPFRLHREEYQHPDRVVHSHRYQHDVRPITVSDLVRLRVGEIVLEERYDEPVDPMLQVYQRANPVQLGDTPSWKVTAPAIESRVGAHLDRYLVCLMKLDA